MRSLFALLLLTMAAAAGAAPVQNSGFEITAKASSWKIGAPGFTFADDDGFGGPGCLVFSGPAAPGLVGASQEVAVKPNTEYVLSVALKSDGSLAPKVAVVRADGNALVTATAGKPKAWTPVLVRFNSGPNENLRIVCVASEASAPEGSHARFDDIALLLPNEVPAGQRVQGGFLANPPGENVARGCRVTFDPAPGYGYCTDAEDAKQITDGEYTAGYFWTQKSTVGWNGASPAIVSIDLGKTQPICGVSYNTAAGVAGVVWPTAIYIAVSDDGKNWRNAGDLVLLAAKNGLPPADRYATYRYVTGDLKTRARYLKLAVASTAYIFCDEVEVYRGPDALLAVEPTGDVVTDVKELARRASTRSGMFWRLTSDLAAARADLDASTVPDAQKATLRARLDAAEKEIEQIPNPDLTTFRAILPLNDTHARILSVYGPILRSRGLPEFFAWKKHRYAFVTPTEAPAEAPSAPPAIAIEMLGGEFRADSFLLTNAGEKAVTATVRVQGVPGAPRPAWLKVSAVPWTDTAQRVPVAAALPDADFSDGAFQVPAPAGMTSKVWLTVDASQLSAGRHAGTLLVEGAGKRLRLPFVVRVSKVKMDQPRLSLGMWDYTEGNCAYGLTPRNRDACIALQRSHFVDTPWAGGSAFPWPAASAFDANHQLKEPLKFPVFDEWAARWPGARQYFVFASVGESFAGAKMGTPEFEARVGTWAKALAQHMTDLGMKPSQLGILLLDEPSKDEQDEIIAAWARVFKAAAPEILLFQDPTWERPDKTKVQEALTLPDILCPNVSIFYKGGPDVAQYFAARRAQGQKLWFYQCSGPARLFDPSRYHRLQSWHAFKHGAVGLGFWAFGDTGGAPTSWNEYAMGRTAYAPAFLGLEDATDGVHWQAVREGMEDYETLSLLRDAAGRTKNAKLKAQAEALLAEAPAAVLGEYTSEYDWRKDVEDRQAPDTYRLKALALLEKMQ